MSEPTTEAGRHEAMRALNRLVPLLPSTARVHEDYNIIKAAIEARASQPLDVVTADLIVWAKAYHEKLHVTAPLALPFDILDCRLCLSDPEALT